MAGIVKGERVNASSQGINLPIWHQATSSGGQQRKPEHPATSTADPHKAKTARRFAAKYYSE